MSNVATLRSGSRPMGIVPQSFEEVQRLASMVVASGLWKGDRKDTDQQKHAKATMAIMQGLECGVPPIQSVQSIAVINGKCVMYGDLLTALLWANGFDIEQTISGSGDQMTAMCTITRPNGKKVTRTFSVAQAKKARLWDEKPTVKKQWDGKWEEKPNDSPWFKYPDRMLAWRALGNAQKDGASDVTKGLAIREDVEAELPMRDITPDDPVCWSFQTSRRRRLRKAFPPTKPPRPASTSPEHSIWKCFSTCGRSTLKPIGNPSPLPMTRKRQS